VVTVERHLCALLSQLHSLPHLALRNISFLSEVDVSEAIFQSISTSRRLGSAILEDVVDRYPRLNLQPEGTVWNSSTAKHADDQRYESAIVDFVLRKSASLPTICPAEFIHQRARELASCQYQHQLPRSLLNECSAVDRVTASSGVQCPNVPKVDAAVGSNNQHQELAPRTHGLPVHTDLHLSPAIRRLTRCICSTTQS
jgi:hypothetical protein